MLPGESVDPSQISTVSARDLWRHEALDFTPWLLNNPGHLSRALSVELELHRAEHAVGPFALDLIGQDVTHGCVLIVENQLEPSDHSHLGQLLTYAAGTRAASVVWVTTHFRNEHGRALEFLNQLGAGGVRFYGVEVYVSREGETLVPELRIVVGPSHHFTPSRSMKASRQADDAMNDDRTEFFNKVLDRLRLETHDWQPVAHARAGRGSPIVRPIPEGLIWCTFLPSQGRIRIDLYFDHQDSLVDRRIFDRMYAQRVEIETASGGPLAWEREVIHGPGCRVAALTDGTALDLNRREEHIAWCAHQVAVIADAAIRCRD
jgi:hypothetical protein